MFTIVASPTFTCKVPLSRPDADVPVQVTFTFRHKTARQLEDYLRRARTGAIETDADLVAEVVEGWGPEIKDENGAQVPYSREALEKLLDQFNGAATEIVIAYRKRLKDARLGN